MRKKIFLFAILAAVTLACGEKKTPAGTSSNKIIDPKTDIGVGSITSVTLGKIDDVMATKGEKLFKGKCSSCHKMHKRYIGPSMANITKRRRGEWIMNMILNPERMVKENAAKKLLMEYSAPMANQSLKKDEARSILEYFRKNDLKK